MTDYLMNLPVGPLVCQLLYLHSSAYLMDSHSVRKAIFVKVGVPYILMNVWFNTAEESDI